MRLPISGIVAVAVLLTVSLDTAHAQLAKEWKSCTGNADVEWDIQITNCTALIKSRKEQKNRAAAYNNRGIEIGRAHV